ncbi:hypothetical protein TWF718_004090 [Orbilia javanica]|uniref:Uncharacterized protein n=1 Tax=Orbilia javanica TaxID=47235 RepID=A0AAN8N5P6_9PEZI
MKDFLLYDELSDSEALDIFKTLDNIPDWVKRRFPDHRFTTLDGLSLAWRVDGWGRPHPLPVGTIWRGQIYDPEGPGPEFATDTPEPFPLYGPGPSDYNYQGLTDYQRLVSIGPGLWGIGDSSYNSYSYYKRDSMGDGHGDREDHQEVRREGILHPIED